MQSRAKPYFYELDTSQFNDCVILVDLQGTLLGAYAEHADERTAQTARALTEHNTVYVFSNSKKPEKVAAIAKELGLHYFESKLYKPDRRLLKLIPNESKKCLVVIGDLVLTDMLFAWLTGSHAVHVRHIRHPSDTLGVKLLYLIDDALAYFLRLL